MEAMIALFMLFYQKEIFMIDEKQRLETVSDWYLHEQLDFDKRLIRYRYQTLKPHFQGPEGLELGPAEGIMTQFLLHDFDRLTVVEGSSELLSHIPEAHNLVKVHSLFEEFVPDKKYNTIILEHILEHVDKPGDLLNRVKNWLVPGGKILLGVPNGLSIHRLVGVNMGFIEHPCQLNSRDLEQGHRRVYTQATLRKEIESVDLKIMEMGGVFFKPHSNQYIQEHWTEEMIQAFYELGVDFPENAADIYAVCKLP